ncbi:adenylosuccinate lyase family protein [Polaromonas sp. P1(28)-13]|nr:adenylosuccinate lyase family protein [Polaromonas sp. P1(28)-13]
MKIGMFESFITGHWFSSEAKRIWSDVATLQAWLAVEAALARAQAELGIIPADAARTIAEKADARLFDLERLSGDIAFAQHPLVPVLHQFEELCGEPAAGFIHWGATTQNIFDTASSLQMIETHRLLLDHLDTAVVAFGKLALEHQATVMPGRTHGQHALPMTFGFKLAGWIDELDRDRDRLKQRLASSFVACLGGAIGTFAAMGGVGRAVEARMAEQLGLQPAGLPMRSSYDRVSDYISALGLLAGTVQKIAQDVVFMQRTEIGEAAEAFHMGKVGSSTMAQKRNPSTALLLTSLARMLRARVPTALEAMVRMDEGDSSATNVTDTLLPEIAIIATSITETLSTLAQGLVVYPEAMRRNLGLSNGLIAFGSRDDAADQADGAARSASTAL